MSELDMWGSRTSCYSACQKCQSTYLHDRGLKLDINDVCGTGVVFSNNAFCMDIVTHVSCIHTLHNFLWYTHNVQTAYSFVPWTEKYLFGCVNDKAVSYSLKTEVQCQDSVICGGQSGTGIGFFLSPLASPGYYHFTSGPYSYSFIFHLHCLVWILIPFDKQTTKLKTVTIIM